MTVGSLFSGIGGFDLAAERVWGAGSVRWQVEVDPYCCRVLAKHWPDVVRFGDIRTLTGEELEPVDLVCGGFPCQPVSVAGKRLAQDDPRWLWPEMRRVVEALRPGWVVGENVPGLLRLGLDEVLSDLEALGYEVGTLGIPACAVGAPHVRQRLWIVANADRAERRAQPEGRIRTNGHDAGREEASGRLEASGPHGGNGALADAQEHPKRAGLCAGGENGRRGRSGDCGCADPASDARGVGCRPGRARRSAGEPAGLRNAAGDVADPERQGLAFGQGSPGERSHPTTPGGGWWTVEPRVGRVAHGVPARVDRLRGLGNAIVPQVAEFLFRQIAAAESRAAA